MSARIEARYWIETAYPLDQAAATMAGEQSTGTFIRVPGETDELRERFAARVEKLTPLEEVGQPSLPGSGIPRTGFTTRRTAEVTLSWPLHNLGPSLPNAEEALSAHVRSGDQAVLFDGVERSEADKVGRILWHSASCTAPLFAVGSSGLTYGLTSAWKAENAIAATNTAPPASATCKPLIRLFDPRPPSQSAIDFG